METKWATFFNYTTATDNDILLATTIKYSITNIVCECSRATEEMMYSQVKSKTWLGTWNHTTLSIRDVKRHGY